jgi:hypothetical protein
MKRRGEKGRAKDVELVENITRAAIGATLT